MNDELYNYYMNIKKCLLQANLILYVHAYFLHDLCKKL